MAIRPFDPHPDRATGVCSVVLLGANGPVSPRRRAVCLLDSAEELCAGDESTRSVMIGRAMGLTMYLTIVDKCASCGVMYSIATVQCYLFFPTRPFPCRRSRFFATLATLLLVKTLDELRMHLNATPEECFFALLR